MKRFLRIITTEWTTIFKDGGLLLILVGAVFIYGTLYPLIYAPQVVRSIPVAVVDQDYTPASRELTRMLDATPEAEVKYHPQSLTEAERLFMEREVYGIVYIPADYEKNRVGGVQNHVSLYADGGYFLLYSNFLSAVSSVVLEAGAQTQVHTLMMNGMSEQQAEWVTQPVRSQVEILFNPYDGYATALMPAVLLLILQQVLLIGTGMMGGTWFERGIWGQFKDYSAARLLLAKVTAYFLLYIPLVFFFFFIQYKLFGYPFNGSTWAFIGVILPYLLSVIFLGQTFGALFRHRESAFMTFISTSVFFLMVSGISWPRQGMPEWIYALGQIVPSSCGIEGLVKIRTMGGGLSDASTEVIRLWVLTGAYAVTAFLAIKRRIHSFPANESRNALMVPDHNRGLPTDGTAVSGAEPDKSL